MQTGTTSLDAIDQQQHDTDQTIRITVIDRAEQVHEMEAPIDMGLNLMELIKAYELPILATCGGMALCSTCHVFIESNHDLPERSEAEELALEQSFHMDEDTSRLSCQLKLTEAMDGLVVKLAPES